MLFVTLKKELFEKPEKLKYLNSLKGFNKVTLQYF